MLPKQHQSLGYLGSNKVLGVCSWCAPIDIDKEMEDMEEIGGMNTQLETSKQLEISPTLLLMLKSWNLGQLCPKNPILLLSKGTLANKSSQVQSPCKKGKT